MISWFVGSSPASGSVLTTQSLEPTSDSMSPSLSALPQLFSLSLSLSKINKKQKQKANRQVSLPHWLLVGNFSSSSQGPLHKTAYDVAAVFLQNERSEGKRQRPQNRSHWESSIWVRIVVFFIYYLQRLSYVVFIMRC